MAARDVYVGHWKKGCGKSTLLYHEAARLTRGQLGEKRNVIWISIAEDDYAMDVRPRLEAAGADCSKVIIPKNWQLVLPRDIDVLRRMANEFRGVGMIGIDPVSGAMPAGLSSNNDEDVRYVIGPLNPLAGELDSLIVSVRICVWGEKPGKTFINQNNCLTRRRARRHRESLRARRPHDRGVLPQESHCGGLSQQSSFCS